MEEDRIVIAVGAEAVHPRRRDLPLRRIPEGFRQLIPGIRYPSQSLNQSVHNVALWSSLDDVSNALALSCRDFPVGGRLMHFQHFWINHIPDRWAVSVVLKGYQIEFHTLPQLTTKVRFTILPQQQHVTLWQEISEMLNKGAIVQVDPSTRGFYSTFFLVPKKDGGQRPVLNLKGLNQFVNVRTFRMQTPQQVLTYLNQGDWLASIDLKDAYFHVPMFQGHHQYLRFAFQGKVYQFKVLPFGLSTAPRVFTKVLAPVIGLLHRQGCHIFPYLDDCLVVAKSPQLLRQSLQCCLEVLQAAGFVINQKKSHLNPVQLLTFLGVELDSTRAMAFLPLDKALRLQQCVRLFMKVGVYLPVRLFLRLLGLMAASLLMVPWARLYMRPLQLYLNSQWDARSRNFDFKVMVPLRLMKIFQWWTDLNHLRKGLPWSREEPSVVITTDASLKA